MQTGDTDADIGDDRSRAGQPGSFWSRLYQALIQPTGQAASPPPPLTLINVLLIGLLLVAWRGAILAISVVWARIGIDNPWVGDWEVHSVLRHSFHWDSGWYLSVAREGYSYNPEAQSNIAFFPMFPYLTRLFDQVLPGNDAYAGLVVVHLALFGALLYIFQLVRIDYTDAVAWRTLFFLLIFPALSGTSLALARYMAILFPVFLLAGKIKSEPVRYALVLVSMFGLAMTTYLFVNGYWAG